MNDVTVPEVDVQEAARRQQAGVLLVDVREPDEYREVHAVGAQLLPLSELTERAAEIPRDRPVLVICRSGARSARAVEWLNERGADTTNVEGGTLAWVAADLPTASGAAS